MNSLKAFEAVSRLMTISAAAKELSVSHGAVSQQIRILEGFLGRALLVRTGNALSLSEAGETYAKTVQRALSLIATETDTIISSPEPVRLRVSAPPTFAVKWLIPNLPRFHNAHADTEISVDVSSKIARLGGDGPHAAIRFGATLNASLDYIDVFTPTIQVVGSPEYFKRKGRVRSLKHLADHQLIEFGPSSSNHAKLHVGWADVTSNVPTNTIRVPEEHVALTAAQEGQGLVLVEDFFVRSDLASGRLQLALKKGFPSKASYRLAIPKRSSSKRQLAVFAAWLSSELNG